MPGKLAPPAGSPTPTSPAVPPVPGDVRASRLYLLSRRHWIGLLRRALSIVLLVVLDVVGLAIGIYLSLVLREWLLGSGDVLWGLLWDKGPADWLDWAAPITVLVFLQAGLYRPRERRPGAGRILSSLIVVALVVFAFGLGTGYDFTTSGLIPTAVIVSAVTIVVLRGAYESVTLEIMRFAGVGRRVVLAGLPASVSRLEAALLAGRGRSDYNVAGWVGEGAVPGVERLGGADDLAAVLARMRPDELVLAEGDYEERMVLDLVQTAHRNGVRVGLVPTTTELLVQRGEYVPGHATPLFELRPPVLTGGDWALKRSFDYVVAVLVAVLGMPLWLLIAAAIKLDSRGPILYVSQRVGVGQSEFGMIKFRTMVEGAAGRQHELEAANEASGALFKIKDDPRVTRVGRVLRRLSLDEVPQILNVLRREMSLVGPRPLPLRDYQLLEDWHKARYNVLPGMTGLWQISGRSGLTFDELVRLDFTYLENWSIWLDVTIIVKTIPAVLSRRGAY